MIWAPAGRLCLHSFFLCRCLLDDLLATGVVQTRGAYCLGLVCPMKLLLCNDCCAEATVQSLPSSWVHVRLCSTIQGVLCIDRDMFVPYA